MSGTRMEKVTRTPPEPSSVAMVRAHLIEVAAATCTALGLPSAARHVTAGRYGHARRLTLDAALRTKDFTRSDRCMSLQRGLTQLHKGTKPTQALDLSTWYLAYVMAGATPDFVMSAAHYRNDPDDAGASHRYIGDVRDREMGFALATWQSLPSRLQPIALGLLEEMSWRRAAEASILITERW